jgi:hypothetical protein
LQRLLHEAHFFRSDVGRSERDDPGWGRHTKGKYDTVSW